jgi:putative transposase
MRHPTHSHRTRMNGAPGRDLFLNILEETRRKYKFAVHGYVVMPEHFHLLMTEPEIADPSVVMKVLKERFSRQINRKRKQAHAGQCKLWEDFATAVWQKRFYDFNVWSERKRVEKLRYMHRNPVKRGLVESPEQWMWSSFCSYFYGEKGLVRANFQEWPSKVAHRPAQKFGDSAA